MEALAKITSTISGYVWGWPLVILLFGTHIYLTIRLGFIQRYIFRAIKISFTPDKSIGQGDVTHFASLATALAATIGTGNIIGVGSAIAVGGPGAVFWMWMTGVLGIATKYGEGVLSVKYRIINERGEMAGGPMYVLEHGLGMKWLGVLFAIFTAIAGFGIGNMTQSNAIVSQIQGNLPNTDPELVKWATGLFLAAVTAAVLIGGVKWIASVCRVLVPFMAVGYMIGCVILAINNFPLLGESLKEIVKGAFTGHEAVAGGFMGSVIAQAVKSGIQRGLFSNESGMGSSPIIAAAAKTPNPVRQALVSASGTFWDTVVICALTGIVIVSSGHWRDGLAGKDLTRMAFNDLHAFGPLVLAFGLGTFVFSTILGWSYFGEKAIEYLFGVKGILPYRIAWVILIVVGAVLPIQIVWDFADIANGLMAVPNLISLLLLTHVIVAETKKYRSELTGEGGE